MKKVIFLLMIISGTPTCTADWIDHSSGLAVWIPEKWEQQTDNDMLKVTSPDNIVTVLYMMIDSEYLETAVNNLEIKLSGIMKKVQVVREIEAVKVNGIPGIVTGGTGFVAGKMKDMKVRWLVSILQCRKNALMVVGFAADDVFNEYEEKLTGMLSSIKNLWIQHPLGVEVWIHPDWLMKTDKDNMTLLSPDNEVIINYHIINAQKLTKALAVMEDQLKNTLSSIRVVNDPEEFVLNDFPGVISSGTGNLKGTITQGEPVKWMVAILFYKDKALMISGFVSEEKFDVYEADIKKILTSIRNIE